ncbi:MAG: ATP-binding protein, partial [Saezia sp.]
MEKYTDTNSWDPLEAAQDSDHEIITSAKKREIKNILKSYVGTYDPMSELIQNAMDSVEKRQSLAGNNYQKKLIIKIDIQDNSFQVIDNGIGFNEDQFRAFIAPNISFKKNSSSRGNKGVGATYIAYGFNHLEVRTKNEDFQFSGHFKGGRDWIEDTSGIVYRPQITKISFNDDIFSSIDQGSSFKIKFGGNNTRPSDLSWYQASTPEQWLYILLVKTPLGHINIPSGSESSIIFDLIVVNHCGEINSLKDIQAKYKFPHEEIKASQRLNFIRDVQVKAIENSKDPSVAI